MGYMSLQAFGGFTELDHYSGLAYRVNHRELAHTISAFTIEGGDHYMLIRDLMTTNVLTCNESTSITEVAKQMSSQNVGSVPVVSGGKLSGIITDRDIVTKCIATGSDSHSMTVSSCMTKNPVTVSSDTDAHDAARMMAAKQIRRLPVVDNGKLVGICALGDLAVVDIHVDEAGEALSGISEQSQLH